MAFWCKYHIAQRMWRDFENRGLKNLPPHTRRIAIGPSNLDLSGVSRTCATLQNVMQHEEGQHKCGPFLNWKRGPDLAIYGPSMNLPAEIRAACTCIAAPKNNWGIISANLWPARSHVYPEKWSARQNPEWLLICRGQPEKSRQTGWKRRSKVVRNFRPCLTTQLERVLKMRPLNFRKNGSAELLQPRNGPSL